MKIERAKNASRNFIFGLALKLYQTLLPFIMRTIMIYYMGVQYLGLTSLFASILQVLNLAELGVGGAMVFSMYKPIAEDDKETICALMNLYRRYYRIIGAVIGMVGIILTPFIPKLIKSDLPAELNIYVLYFLNLSATVLSYWLFAYKNCLFTAHQRNDIPSKVQLLSNSVQFFFQIVIIIYVKNYYLYVLVMLGTQILTNIITALCADRMYSEYRPGGKLPKEQVDGINRRIRDLFTAKIGAVIVNSADTVVISAFLGLTVLSIYQNYFFILTSIIGFITIIFNSCIAGIGNSLVTESEGKNYRDLNILTFIIMWIAGFCVCCFACLYQPFMEIWVGKKLMLHYSAVICLCIYFYIYEINQLLNVYKDAAGIWHKDRFRPLVTASANLIVNLILVQFWGIYGVIFSTVLSTVIIGMPWLLHNLFTTIFEKKWVKQYIFKILKYSASSLVACLLCIVICSWFKGALIGVLIIRLMICVIVANSLLVLLFRKDDDFLASKELVLRILKRKRGG